MGIGRRKFVKMASLSLAGLGVNPVKASFINENMYVNSKLGIMFEKPDGWTIRKKQDFGEMFDKQILDDGWENFKNELKEDLDEPICVIAKYYAEDDRYNEQFSPSIVVEVTAKSDFNFLEGASFNKVAEISHQFTESFLKDFKVLKEYPPYSIDGVNFLEYDAQYLFEHIDLKEPILTELKVIKAETENYFYDFNMHQSKAKNEIADIEFTKFKNSLKFL